MSVLHFCVSTWDMQHVEQSARWVHCVLSVCVKREGECECVCRSVYWFPSGVLCWMLAWTEHCTLLTVFNSSVIGTQDINHHRESFPFCSCYSPCFPCLHHHLSICINIPNLHWHQRLSILIYKLLALCSSYQSLLPVVLIIR